MLALQALTKAVQHLFYVFFVLLSSCALLAFTSQNAAHPLECTTAPAKRYLAGVSFLENNFSFSPQTVYNHDNCVCCLLFA